MGLFWRLFGPHSAHKCMRAIAHSFSTRATKVAATNYYLFIIDVTNLNIPGGFMDILPERRLNGNIWISVSENLMVCVLFRVECRFAKNRLPVVFLHPCHSRKNRKTDDAKIPAHKGKNSLYIWPKG